ncbi:MULTISPECIES: hypothetical protein [Vibrio]|uniref:hypothetical protein n=1 Tax=Vibrio TaxID=662 RepID=UPI001A9076A4|nr:MULTISPECIES: hypothetical protein [Vibrio]MBO0246485.1 hypothetical protein [Vibrio sp. Vb0592]MCR9637431.1 hypothetical protein [Vibrio alginolyticus]MDW1736827.1 hypothetical protein [Vibrio sp. Vb2235]MDW1789101.1 hypothetical protein [Vibrio sp. Vb2227]MDW1818733.1 hypothetical protein [Vibrio sp. Vb2232]
MEKNEAMVNQEVDTTGCGIATFANACSISSFEHARGWMLDRSFCKQNEFVTIPQMKSALELWTGKTITLHNSISSLSDEAVLFVEYEKGTSDRHWVYYKNGIYFDPLPCYSQGVSTISYKVTRLLNIHS